MGFFMQTSASIEHLNDLIFFALDESIKYQVPSLTAFKSGSKMCPCNRAIITKDTDLVALQTLHNFYADIPYALWLDCHDDGAKDKAMQHGFSYVASFSAMNFDMGTLKNDPVNDHILVRPVANDEELFATGLAIMVQS